MQALMNTSRACRGVRRHVVYLEHGTYAGPRASLISMKFYLLHDGTGSSGRFTRAEIRISLDKIFGREHGTRNSLSDSGEALLSHPHSRPSNSGLSFRDCISQPRRVGGSSGRQSRWPWRFGRLLQHTYVRQGILSEDHQHAITF